MSNVLIVDDHPLYGDALASALELGFDGCETRQARTLRETIAALDAGFEPDLIMFDLKLPDVTGISGFHSLRQHAPHVPVLVISSLASNDLVHSLLDSGADGFLLKDASAVTLKFAIEEILGGRRYIPEQYRQVGNSPSAPDCVFDATPELTALTGQQRRILKLICLGKPNKQIAYELSLAEATVKAHITALLRRLGVHNRTQAVVLVDAARARQGGSEPEAQAFLSQ